MSARLTKIISEAREFIERDDLELDLVNEYWTHFNEVYQTLPASIQSQDDYDDIVNELKELVDFYEQCDSDSGFDDSTSQSDLPSPSNLPSQSDSSSRDVAFQSMIAGSSGFEYDVAMTFHRASAW